MILVANRIFVAPAHAGAFETMLETRASLVDRMPGFVAIQLLRPTKADDPYLTLTIWESRQMFETWLASEEFLRGHARMHSLPPGTFTHATDLEIHEVFHTSHWPGLPSLDAASA